MLRFFTTHPTASNLISLVIFALGIAVIPFLRRETFPNFTAEEVEIRVIYPGASTEEIEEAICQRIEEAIDRINELEEVRSEAREGLGTVIVKMRRGGSFDRFVGEIKTEVEAIDNFPESAEAPIIKPLGQTDPVTSVAVTGPMSASDLKFYAEVLKEKMLQLPEISQVEVAGFSDHQIRIELHNHILQQYGISVSDIAQRLRNMSLNLPAGVLETRDQDILVRFHGEKRTVQEFQDLVILGNFNGAEIHLGDIAVIEDLFEDTAQKISFNGKRAALLHITKTRSEDTLQIGNAVRTFVEQEQKKAPPGVQLVLTRNVFSIVQDRLDLLTNDGWQGFILVALTLWIFFNFKLSFWVVIGFPVSLCGTLFMMHLFGESLNMITMVGLLIALGLVMDDSIVISENVARHLAVLKKNPENAAFDGFMEVKVGVFASFMTTTVVFCPLMFLEGDIGKVLRVMPLMLMLTMLVSLIDAFFLLPSHLSHSLKVGDFDRVNPIRRAFDQKLTWVQENVVGRCADLAISWRYLFFGIVIAVFLSSVSMIAGGILKFKAFPDLDGDIIEARLLLPQGTPLHRTETIVHQILQALDRVNRHFSPLQPHQQSMVQNINIQWSHNIDAKETGPHVATIGIDLLTAEERSHTLDEFVVRWRQEIGPLPDVLQLTFKEPSIGPQGIPIEIRLKGPRFDLLKEASLEFQQWLNRYQGVLDVFDDLRPGKSEILLHLKPGAVALGFNATMIALQLRASFYGETATEIQVGKESYEIDVRLHLQDRNSIADLEYFTLISPSGQQVFLKTVAEMEVTRGYARVQRIDGMRTVTIQGDIDSHQINVNEMIAETQKNFLPDFLKKYPDILCSFEGEHKNAKETGGSLVRSFILGVFGIFVLLSFQFRSYLEPFSIMLAIPFAFIGVIWGHLLLGLPLTMPSMVGYVSLAGVVVNDSILLVEFLKMRMAEGLSLQDAAKQASRDRFRAVLLTSACSIAGTLPLLFETSLQAQVLIPLVTSLTFGLASSTVLILLYVPAIYVIFDDWGLIRKLPIQEKTLGS